MNDTHRDAPSYLDALLSELGEQNSIEVVLIPPFTAIPALAEALTKTESAKLGAQNVHWAPHGAFTGEVSVAMLHELGVSYVVLGHSERRALFAETDEVVNRKLLSALNSGLCPIFCVGESLREREDDRVEAALEHQLRMGLDRVPTQSICDVVIAEGTQVEKINGMHESDRLDCFSRRREHTSESNFYQRTDTLRH
jgi:triosephosphate isomerase